MPATATVACEALAAEVRSVLDRVGAVDWQASDPGAVALFAPLLLQGGERMIAQGLLAMAQHESDGGISRDGDANAGDWTSRQTKSSKDSGRRQAARAKRLSKAKKTAKAAAEGTLSPEQADKLASARNEENADLFDQLEDELIAKAAGSYDDAEKVAREFREATGETPEQRAERLWKRRSASCWDDDEGMVQTRSSLSGDAGAEAKAVFDAYVDLEFKNRERGDTRTHAQVRADAYRAMTRAAKAKLVDDTPSLAERVTAVVQVRYEDLVDDNIAEWAGIDQHTGLELSGHAIRRLCCDADIVRLVTVGDSVVIDMGRKTATVSTKQRKAALARDGGCVFPGCHCRDGVQVHHITFWAKGGFTDLANLVCLCWKHHRLVHEGGWRLEYDQTSARHIFTAPDGRRLIGQRRATAGAQRSMFAA